MLRLWPKTRPLPRLRVARLTPAAGTVLGRSTCPLAGASSAPGWLLGASLTAAEPALHVHVRDLRLGKRLRLRLPCRGRSGDLRRSGHTRSLGDGVDDHNEDGGDESGEDDPDTPVDRIPL